MLQIVPATTAQDLSDVRMLFGEYQGLVAEALCFQNFGRELEALPGAYAPPGGMLWIARDGGVAAQSKTGGDPAGCAALRRIDAGTGEMKRMYVRERYRGSGLGRRLALEVIEAAQRLGCGRVVLDTLPKLAPAIALYRDLGFRECAPYLPEPTPGALCFEFRFS